MATKEKPYKDLPRPKLNRATIAELYARLLEFGPRPKPIWNIPTPTRWSSPSPCPRRARMSGSTNCTRKLFALASTPQAMVDLGEDAVRGHIKTIGLYRNKARNVVALSRMILDEYGGQVPRTRDELVRLPGVGRKTANVVLNEAFGQPTMAVDTHIFRVSNRTGMAPGKDVVEVELNLLRVTPDEFRLPAHHLLLLHGRYTCLAPHAQML